MAVKVSNVVIEIPIRASTMLGGIRKQSHVINMKKMLGIKV